jgi:hypothetical protein
LKCSNHVSKRALGPSEIPEAAEVQERSDHDRKQKFWTRNVIFTSQDAPSEAVNNANNWID